MTAPPPARSTPTIRVVLDDLTHGGGHAHFGVDIAGGTLPATHVEWSYGSEPPLRGLAEDLVLQIRGRTVPAGPLDPPTAGHRAMAGPGSYAAASV